MSNLDAAPEILVELCAQIKQFGPLESDTSKQFLQVLTARILCAPDSRWNAGNISKAMLGFRGIYSQTRPDKLCDFPHLMALLDIIHAKMRAVEEPFAAQEVGHMCYGLQNFDGNRRDIESLIRTVTGLVETCDDVLSAQQFGNICYGFKNLNSSSDVILQYITVLCDRFDRVTEPLCAQHMGNACYGLRGLRNKVPQIERLVCIVAKKITQSHDCLNGQLLGNSLYGMKSMTISPGARALMDALAAKIPTMTGLINSQGVGNALYGLKNMSSDSQECRNLLHALAPTIEASHGALTAQEVSNAIYGLQHMSSNQPEVRMLLKALTPRVMSCQETFRSQHVGNCMYGLRNMSSDCEEVCGLIAALAPYFANCHQKLKPQEIGNAFYGFRKMTSNRPEVLNLLSVIEQLAAAADKNQTMSSQEIANAFYGLNGMDGEHEIIRKVLKTLAEWCTSSPAVFNAQEVGNSIYGLRGVRLCDELREAFAALTPKVHRCSAQLQARNISNAFRGFFKITFESTEVWSMFRALALHFTNMVGGLDSQSVGNVLLGLRGCDPAQMIPFLQEFGMQVPRCTDNLRANDFANGIYGLVCMITNGFEKHGAQFETEVMWQLMQVMRSRVNMHFGNNERNFNSAMGSLYRSLDNINTLICEKYMSDPSMGQIKNMLEGAITTLDPHHRYRHNSSRSTLFTPPTPYAENEIKTLEYLPDGTMQIVSRNGDISNQPKSNYDRPQQFGRRN